MFRHLILAAILTLALIPGLSAQPDKPTGPAAADAQPVEVNPPAADEAIRKRIAAIFSEIDGFHQIEVSVQSGVVTLTGEVPDTKTRDEAMALVRRTQGVVLTLDRLDEPAEVSARLSPAVAKFKDLVRSLKEKLPLIGIALVLLIAFVVLANLIHGRARWFARLGLSSLAETLVRRIARFVIVGIGVVLALEVLDATAIVGAVLGAAGLVGIALGFALKNILENHLAGIMLSTRNPFDIGDTIEINGRSGKVARLTARDTVLVTLDGNHLRIPNGQVINSELINYTRNPLRRFEFVVGVSVDLDLNEARGIGLATLARNPAVLAEPKPLALVDELGDSTVKLRFQAWLDQTKHDFLKTRSQSIRMIKEAFDNAGIEMPEPIYRVRLRDVTPPPDAEPPAKVVRSAAPSEAPDEDLSADHTIDRQIQAEKLESTEENLLPENP
jgi:small conductance mechanosensitive channel